MDAIMQAVDQQQRAIEMAEDNEEEEPLNIRDDSDEMNEGDDEDSLNGQNQNAQ